MSLLLLSKPLNLVPRTLTTKTYLLKSPSIAKVFVNCILPTKDRSRLVLNTATAYFSKVNGKVQIWDKNRGH